MKQLLLNCSRFLLIQFIIGAVLLFFAWDRIDRQVDYDASILDKHALLERQPSPRLILVGGSNVAFGFDSPVLEERLNMHPVNMATHAAMGRRWILEDVRDELREGDAVIVSLEYEAFGQYKGDFPSVLRMIRIRPESISAISWGQTRYFLDEGFRIFGSLSRRGWRRMKRWDFSPAAPLNHAYTRDSFNDYGDNIGASNPEPVAKRITKPNPMPGLTEESVGDAIAELNDFARDCENRGVRVFFVYSPLLDTHFAEAQERIAMLDRELRQKLVFPVLTTPEEMIVPMEMIFDAKEHLTREGARWRSELVAERVKPRIVSGPSGDY